MGYEGVMGYGSQIPANHLGNSKILWGFREYGFWEVWVKREATVLTFQYNFYSNTGMRERKNLRDLPKNSISA
jgi:hypothetical protein